MTPSVAHFAVPKCIYTWDRLVLAMVFNLCQFLLQDSNVPSDVTYGQKQKLKFAYEQLKTKALQLNCWDRSELEGLSSTT